MLRNILLWWRAKGCFHKPVPSNNPRYLGQPQCERCGTVFHYDGKPFGRQRESIIELDAKGFVTSITQPT